MNRIKQKQIFINFLQGLSWSHSLHQRPEIVVNTNNPPVLLQFLHGLSYSRHTIKYRLHKTRLKSEVAAIQLKMGKLWDKAHEAMQNNRNSMARNALIKLIEIDPYNAAAYNRLGITYAKWHKLDEAIEAFERAFAIEPTASAAHNLGLVYYQNNQFGSALKYFKKSLSIDNSLAARHVALAKTYEKLNNEELMFKHLIKAVNLEPSIEVYKLLYTAYIERGRTSDAIAIQHRMEDRIKRTEREITEITRVTKRSSRTISDEPKFSFQYS